MRKPGQGTDDFTKHCACETKEFQTSGKMRRTTVNTMEPHNILRPVLCDSEKPIFLCFSEPMLCSSGQKKQAVILIKIWCTYSATYMFSKARPEIELKTICFWRPPRRPWCHGRVQKNMLAMEPERVGLHIDDMTLEMGDAFCMADSIFRLVGGWFLLLRAFANDVSLVMGINHKIPFAGQPQWSGWRGNHSWDCECFFCDADSVIASILLFSWLAEHLVKLMPGRRSALIVQGSSGKVQRNAWIVLSCTDRCWRSRELCVWNAVQCGGAQSISGKVLCSAVGGGKSSLQCKPVLELFSEQGKF